MFEPAPYLHRPGQRNRFPRLQKTRIVMTALKPAQQTDTAFQGHPMEHPFSLHPIRRRPLATKKLGARTARRAARQALRCAMLPSLPTIPDVEFLTPNSPKYDQSLAASNLRTTQRPAVGALGEN